MKCFLSHSSKDKKTYVEIVARILGPTMCEYDEWSFEEGLKTLEEIDRGLDESSLFVLFISGTALASEWVQKELKRSVELHALGKLKRIFPIIIDPNVKYDDSRIPEWMRQEYNLKYVSRPNYAARRIRQRLREISWDCHPHLLERERIFVGRNPLVAAFEERLDAVDIPSPVCIVASGIKRIGRKALLRHSLTKSNVVRESFKPSLICLEASESIEDFILKLNDLALTTDRPVNNFMKMTVRDKVEIAVEILKEIKDKHEIVFIDDSACLITHDRNLAPWFRAIIDRISHLEAIVLAVASSVRIQRTVVRNYPAVFHLEVPELEPTERQGLLRRYAEFEKIDLKTEDFKFFMGILTGLPEQVLYVIDLIKDEGLLYAKANSYLIAEYNTEKVIHLLSNMSADPKATALLALLARFDFISTEFLDDLIKNEKPYVNLMRAFYAEALCEQIGANGEYIRLNGAVRDYVLRAKFDLSQQFQERLENHIKDFLVTYQSEQKDLSDLMYSLKEALVQGKDVDERYLAPSHFLRTMRDLYDQHNKYRDVIKLAERVLRNESFMDSSIVSEIRYFQCMSLARLRDSQFLDEVHKIRGAEHNFLMGFYYRMIGKYAEALERLDAALGERPGFSRAKREKVQTLISIEQYDTALDLAKQNYENEKTNPFHIHAYFNCLLRSGNCADNRVLLEDLLKNLQRLPSERAQEMVMGCRALFWAYVDNDRRNSYRIAKEYCQKYGHLLYPYMTMFDIAQHFRDIAEMKESLQKLSAEVDRDSKFSHALVFRKAILATFEGNRDEGHKILDNELKNLPASSIVRWKNRIDQLSPVV
jgi:tetratricopeptide (TPR) repeat protein